MDESLRFKIGIDVTGIGFCGFWFQLNADLVLSMMIRILDVHTQRLYDCLEYYLERSMYYCLYVKIREAPFTKLKSTERVFLVFGDFLHLHSFIVSS